MTIIVLQGGHSCGKTTTLNIVYNRLLSGGGVSTGRRQEGGNPHDFSDIVLYGVKKVAFYTMGDYAGHLMDAITRYNGLGVDVLVCACNTGFVRPFRLIATYPHHNIPKTVAATAPLRIIANDADAAAIIALI